MKIQKKTLAALASATVLAVSLPAQANGDHADFKTYECDSMEIAELREVLELYVNFANDVEDPDTLVVSGKDRDGLNGKLDMADAKIVENKDCDAAQKLDDFSSNVFTLDTRSSLAKPKISEDFEGAIQCLIVGADHKADDLRLNADPACDATDSGGKGNGKGPNK